MAVSGLAWFLAWLFARAATHKVRAVQYYTALMGRYLGVNGSAVAVCLLAAAEAVVALSLLAEFSRRLGLLVSMFLLLFYAGLMVFQLVSGKGDMHCGCSGPDSPLQVSWALVLRNTVCAGLALLALQLGGAAASGWFQLLGSVGIALMLIAAYLFCEALIANAQWMMGED